VLLLWALATVGVFASGKRDSKPSKPVSEGAKLMNPPFLPSFALRLIAHVASPISNKG